MAKYLKNTETGVVFIHTDSLAKLPEMAVCDEKGNILSAEKYSAPAEPEPEKTAATGPTLEDFKVLVEKMEREELEAKANELEIEFAPNIGDAKLRERVLGVIADRLAATDGDN